MTSPVLRHRVRSLRFPLGEVLKCAKVGDLRWKNPFLFHKTTNRSSYDLRYYAARSEGFFHIVFTNERGEITEGAITNVFIKRGSMLYTPPVSCGLLDGTFRRKILENHFSAEECILSKDDVRQTEEIYLTNAIRGMIPAVLME